MSRPAQRRKSKPASCSFLSLSRLHFCVLGGRDDGSGGGRAHTRKSATSLSHTSQNQQPFAWLPGDMLQAF